MNAKEYRWHEVKKRGSGHYKTEDVEPIDLIKAGGLLRNFALGNIIKYAFRNSDPEKPLNRADLDKIQHYVEMLLCLEEEVK
ncbi:MAG: DUF3310 domain-containing protein [Gammaproteobacteria bacterium]|nr:DUF3310 domain-containing protein [Gammaproteobacteria bacterium]